MATWSEFEAANPEMAARGRSLFYQFGIGLGFMATIRADGGPRLHPFCPIVAEGGVFGFIIDSPKRRDLLRDGRVAIHACGGDEVDDEFYFTGNARRIDDPSTIEKVLAAYRASGGDDDGHALLFEFDIERAMLATYEKRPSWPPVYTKWAAPEVD
ncbi:MAG: pyridoxamine 5'-phosphate oxidase family protein [Tepidiformaceae bacterium]